MRIFLFGLLLALPVQSMAEGAKEKYFYSVPSEAGPEWNYAAPDCEAVTPSEERKMRNCSMKENFRSCDSTTRVELMNGNSNRSRHFKLVYRVYDSKPACEKDRDNSFMVGSN